MSNDENAIPAHTGGATLRVGTRGSRLARWQADEVARRLEALGFATEIHIIQTRGDLDQRTEFGQMGDKGIFVKEIESALRNGTIDLAVHSLKDLPSTQPSGLELGAVLPRESARDAWIGRDGARFADLPAGARVATGSLRRAAQTLRRRPDLRIVPLRGNVPTRLEKIQAGKADGTLLAVAGLRRLGLTAAITEELDEIIMVPAMGQGAIAIETRAGELSEAMAELNDATTRAAVEAERAFMRDVGGGCRTPAGVHARHGDRGWELTALLATADGQTVMCDGFVTSDEYELPSRAAELGRAMRAGAPPEIRAILED